MTVMAFLAIQTLMLIDELMTEIAIPFQLALIIGLLVTLIAYYVLMFTLKRKLGVLVMIKLG